MENFGIYKDKTYPIIWRKKGNEATDECPFCGKKHIHGISEGHRLVHCETSLRRLIVRSNTIYAPEDGYILKEY
jgi:hypothetical protein